MFIKTTIFILISLTISIKANSNQSSIDLLKEGGKLIFIRHAIAPGNGDPANFDINDCSTQRNLNSKGRKQALMIKSFFKENQISIYKVVSSEWCRCKETASIIFENKYKTKSFLNSFYSKKFSKNKKNQIIQLKKYVSKWNGKKNLILVTHYVVISELLNVYPSSGGIVISDINYNVVGNLEFNF